MRTIAERIWSEPAVAIGLLVSVLLLVANAIAGEHWSVAHVIGMLAPLLSALGIRQLVEPVQRERLEAHRERLTEEP